MAASSPAASMSRRVVGLALERPAAQRLGRRRPDVAGGQGARGVVAHVEPEQLVALLAHEAVGVVEGVLAGGVGADEVHLELHAQHAGGLQLAVERLQHLEVRAVDVDLEIVELRPAARRQQLGHRHRLRAVGELGHLPFIVAQLFLDLGLGEPRGADLARAHEAQALADRHDQRRGLAALEIDRPAGDSGHERRHILDARQGLRLGEPRALGAAGIDADRLQPRPERAPARIESARAADVEQPERRGAERVRDQGRESAVHPAARPWRPASRASRPRRAGEAAARSAGSASASCRAATAPGPSATRSRRD